MWNNKYNNNNNNNNNKLDKWIEELEWLPESRVLDKT